MTEFVMPILGSDMEAGTLVAWRKQPGDRVERGEVIAEVETDKGLIEIEVFTSGVLERILVTPGEKVPVGTVMAIIREEGHAQPVTAAAPSPPPSDAQPTAHAPAGGPPRPAVGAPPAESGRVRASPAARQRAGALGIDLASVRGTGPGGAVHLEDVERAAATAAGRSAPEAAARAAGAIGAGSKPGDTASRSAAMRQTIGAAMARSKREIPHYYLATTIDVHRALAWMETRNRGRPITERLLYGVLLIKAVALALREVPELNGIWTDDGAVTRADVHVGVAISLRGGGLVAPALHHTDRLGLDELMRCFRDLVARARAGSLRSSELSDPTITVTSLGEQGVESVFGIIYPPQVAIVGFGKVVERPWSVAGAVVSRPIVTATLAADHRVSDGHRGGRFLATVDQLLQDPERL